LYLIPIAVVFLAMVGIVTWIVIRSQRSQKLRQKFGPEYDYTVEKVGDRRKAEEHLAEREQRVNKLEIRTLEQSEWTRFHTRWLNIQSGFVDEPANAVQEANKLIKEVMVARGFPLADFDQRAEDISVLYPDFVSNYRNAHSIAIHGQRNGVSTEEYRQAMVYYRSLFDELLETEESREKEEVG
jgi:hypothetical protein